MPKKVIIIHGWTGSPTKDWLDWLKTNLEQYDYEVLVPKMPNTNNPNLNSWLEHLTNIVGTPDENCYFVGHSLGCITIMRYLESLKNNQKIGGTVFVAGFITTCGHDKLESFFTKNINWSKIKTHCKAFISIQSDNNSHISLPYEGIFKDKLNAQVIIEHNKKHFTGDEGVNELPIALESVLNISR